MKPILEFALDLATEAHAGQKRRDGKDYITHPIAVAEIVKKKYFEESDPNIGVVSKNHIAVIAAYLHDVPEDTKIDELECANRFVDAGYFTVKNSLYDMLYSTLLVLNKNGYSCYAGYIDGMIHDRFARDIKLADLEHNLSDLKPGSLRDKYELAQLLLKRS